MARTAPEAFELTRVTAWCVLRAAEAKRFPCVVVENVVEFITGWGLYPEWIRCWKKLGYRVQVVSVSSAHIGSETNPYAPQWRDRVYMVFTLTGIRRPDLTPRPQAYCVPCGRDVRARQSWRDPKVKVGKYGQQYDYRCPNTRCGHALVEPYVRPASDVIMWGNIGQRIGDRDRPLVPNTMRRIEAGLAKFPRQPSVVTLTHGKDGTDRAFAPDTRPLPVRTVKVGEALLVPVGGSWNDTASSAVEPMRTRMTRESEALVTVDPFIVEFRNNCDTASVDNPLSTLAGARHHGLVVADGVARDRARNTLVIPYRKAAPKTAASRCTPCRPGPRRPWCAAHPPSRTATSACSNPASTCRPNGSPRPTRSSAARPPRRSRPAMPCPSTSPAGSANASCPSSPDPPPTRKAHPCHDTHRRRPTDLPRRAAP